jgi:hypothetical protein
MGRKALQARKVLSDHLAHKELRVLKDLLVHKALLAQLVRKD